MSNDETDSMTEFKAHRYYQPTSSIEYALNINDDGNTTEKPCL